MIIYNGKTMEKYYKIVAEKHGIPQGTVRYATKHFCREAKDYLKECDNKGVLINGFGTLLPHKPSIDAKIKRYIRFLRKDVDEASKERARKKLKTYWKFRRKIQPERYKYF